MTLGRIRAGPDLAVISLLLGRPSAGSYTGASLLFSSPRAAKKPAFRLARLINALAAIQSTCPRTGLFHRARRGTVRLNDVIDFAPGPGLLLRQFLSPARATPPRVGTFRR